MKMINENNEMNEALALEVLYSALVSLGDCYPLKISIDIESVNQELIKFSRNWVIYNKSKKKNNRYGLSLTSIDGGMEGFELTSLTEFNALYNTEYSEVSFKKETDALKRMLSIREPIRPFLKYLGRSHFIKLNAGGFFPTHRDSHNLGIETFRLVSLLSGCDRDSFQFIYDGKKITLEQGRLYFLNTRKAHSIFSFKDEAILLVFNVILSKKAVDLVIKSLDSY